MAFLERVAKVFGVDCLMHNEGPSSEIRKVALCGGSGDFLLEAAIAQKADAFLTGEMSYHRYFGQENSIWLGVLGHYQSEQFTIELLSQILETEFPTLPIYKTEHDTNPIKYMWRNK